MWPFNADKTKPGSLREAGQELDMQTILLQSKTLRMTIDKVFASGDNHIGMGVVQQGAVCVGAQLRLGQEVVTITEMENVSRDKPRTGKQNFFDITSRYLSDTNNTPYNEPEQYGVQGDTVSLVFKSQIPKEQLEGMVLLGMDVTA